MITSESLDSSPSRTIGWAFFLGASWTWCIGMFFPVLLVRDFGLWGWIVFAFPNVMGSAVAGAVLGNSDRSKKLLGQHAPAAVVFSLVTIAFHVFFVGWKLLPLVGLIPATGVFLLAGIFFAIGGGTRRDLVIAVLVILISLVAMGFALTQPLGAGTLLTHADPAPGLLALTPVCMVGFFLCPYLDLTYHRARQATAPVAGARAFQIGFAGPFLAMIVFTLLYAHWLDQRHDNPVLLWAVGIHMIVQIAFTLSLHVRGVLDVTALAFKRGRWLLLAAVLVPLALIFLVMQFPILRWQDSGEVVYLCFLACYGFLFPASVWLCMIPTADGPQAPDRGRLLRVLLVSAIAFPCYWMGFIERQVWWLIPGVLILIASRRTLPREKSRPGALT
ncbi:hypothetical protein BH10PLA1_BH10PLA1_06720 [soil metagenome]